MENKIYERAREIVSDDLKSKRKQLRQGSVNTATALNTAVLGLLDGSCRECLALQVLDRRVIGCAAGTDQHRKMANSRMEGDLSVCKLKTDIPNGSKIEEEEGKMVFSGSKTFFSNLAGK
jgi:hypothetical protein